MTTETLDKPCRKLRDIILDWPDPPVPFPKRVPLPEDPPYPLLMAPYRGGFQAMYDPATGLFHSPHVPPAWNYYEVDSPYILMGETFRSDMMAPEYLVKFLINQITGIYFPLQPNLFQVNDTGQKDRDATQRSYNVVNLPKQSPEVFVPQVYQANSNETLNKYLKAFHDQGFIGAICRTLPSGCSDNQFIVLDPVEV